MVMLTRISITQQTRKACRPKLSTVSANRGAITAGPNTVAMLSNPLPAPLVIAFVFCITYENAPLQKSDLDNPAKGAKMNSGMGEAVIASMMI